MVSRIGRKLAWIGILATLSVFWFQAGRAVERRDLSKPSVKATAPEKTERPAQRRARRRN